MLQLGLIQIITMFLFAPSTIKVAAFSRSRLGCHKLLLAARHGLSRDREAILSFHRIVGLGKWKDPKRNIVGYGTTSGTNLKKIGIDSLRWEPIYFSCVHKNIITNTHNTSIQKVHWRAFESILKFKLDCVHTDPDQARDFQASGKSMIPRLRW